MRSRSLNNTALFPPSSSASGQAFDAAVCIGGLLLDSDHLTAGLRREIGNLAAQANRGGDTKPLEEALMDFMSLGERFDWDQLMAFVAQIPDTGTLHQLAGQARNAGTTIARPVRRRATVGQARGRGRLPRQVQSDRLARISAPSLRYGAGGVGELAQREQRFYDPDLGTARDRVCVRGRFF